jgi:DNA methylase
LKWFYETAVMLNEFLSESGSLYVHLDWHIGPYAKAILDDVFGSDRFLSDIIWKRTSAHSGAGRHGPVHDVILFYTKTDSYVWNEVYQAYDDEYVETFFEQVDPDGRRWKRGDLTGPGTRTGESGKSWRGINVTAKGRHWQPASYVYDKFRRVTGNDLAAYPLLERLDKLDEIGLIHWPKKRDGMPRYKCYLEDMPGIPLQDVWTDSVGNLRYYEPDFVVLTNDGTHYIVETKGLEDTNVANKDRAAQLWCENTTKLAGKPWAYVKVLQTAYKKLQPTQFEDLFVLAQSKLL